MDQQTEKQPGSPEITEKDLPADYEKKYQEALAALHAEKAIAEEIYTTGDVIKAYASGKANSPEELKEYIRQAEIEFNRRAAEITLARVSDYKDLNAPSEKAGEQKFLKATAALWKEFAVHGKAETDPKTGEEKIRPYSDLDGKCSLYLLHKAGIDTKDLEYVKPGDAVGGKINLDTGDRSGLVVEDEGKTAFLDHHTEEAGRDTSATKITYETLIRTGLLKKEEYLDQMVEFVTQMDNNNYPEAKKYYRDSWQMMLGMHNFIQADKLATFFRDGKNPTDILSPEELKQYSLIYKTKDRKTQKEKEINRSQEQKERIEKSWVGLQKMEKEGWIIDSERYGKIAVDRGNDVPGGAAAAEAYGCDAYIIWSPDKQSFFISTTREITDTFSQGKKIRGSMWMKPTSDKTPLAISLEEILQKMTDNKFEMPAASQEKAKKGKEKEDVDQKKAPKTKEEESKDKKEEAPGKKKEELMPLAQEVQEFLKTEKAKAASMQEAALDPQEKERIAARQAILADREKKFSLLEEQEKARGGRPAKAEAEKIKRELTGLKKEITAQEIEQYLTRKKEKPQKIENKEKDQEKQNLAKLENDLKVKREEYLEAKRLRGKFFGRKGFGGKLGKEKLAKIGDNYNEARTAYIREKTKSELKNTALEGEKLNQTIVEKLLDQYAKENNAVENLITSREKGGLARFTAWWRRHPKTRILAGAGLTAAAIGAGMTGQFWILPAVTIARAGFSGVGATIGTEGLLSRYSKSLGERGMVNKFAKLSPEQKRGLKKIKDRKQKREARQMILTENAYQKIEKLTPEQFAQLIAPELARLRTLSERKGVRLEQVGSYAGITAAFRAKEQKLMAQNALEIMREGEQSKEKAISQALAGSLEREARLIDQNVEAAGDTERKKAVKRWAFSAAAGAIVAGATAYTGFHRFQHLKGARGATKTILGARGGKHIVQLSPEHLGGHLEMTARSGDSVWKMARRALETNEQYSATFKGLNEAQKTYVIDAIKDKVAAHPAQFGLANVDRIRVGQKLNLGAILRDQETMARAFKKAGGSTQAQMENILKNNALLREFHSAHPKMPMTSENVDAILKGKAEKVLTDYTPSGKTAAVESATSATGKTTGNAAEEAARGAADTPPAAPEAPAVSTGNIKEAATETVTPKPPQTETPTTAAVKTPPTTPPQETVAPSSPEIPISADITSRLVEIQNPECPADRVISEFLQITKEQPSLQNLREISLNLKNNLPNQNFIIKNDAAAKLIDYAAARGEELSKITNLAPTQELEKTVLEKMATIVLGRMEE